jgi:hypothetical protein
LSSLTLCFPIGFHFLAYPNLFGIKGFVVVVVDYLTQYSVFCTFFISVVNPLYLTCGAYIAQFSGATMRRKIFPKRISIPLLQNLNMNFKR